MSAPSDATDDRAGGPGEDLLAELGLTAADLDLQRENSDAEDPFNDPEIRAALAKGDVRDQLARVEQLMHRLSTHSELMRRLSTEISEEGSNRHVTVAVGVSGVLQQVTIHPYAHGRPADELTQAFKTAYQDGHTAAHEAYAAALREEGITPPSETPAGDHHT